MLGNSESHAEQNENSVISKEKIEYLTYCHQTINGLKSSIYDRASILIVAIAFVVPCGATTMTSLFSTPIKNVYLRWFSYFSSAVFIISFLLAIGTSVRCLIPIRSREFLKQLLNIQRNTKKMSSMKKELVNANPDMSIREFLAENNQVEEVNFRTFTTFDHIYDLSETEFIKMADNLDTYEIYKQLLSGLYNMSHISRMRYSRLLRAFYYLLVNILFLVLLIILNIIV